MTASDAAHKLLTGFPVLMIQGGAHREDREISGHRIMSLGPTTARGAGESRIREGSKVLPTLRCGRWDEVLRALMSLILDELRAFRLECAQTMLARGAKLDDWSGWHIVQPSFAVRLLYPPKLLCPNITTREVDAASKQLWTCSGRGDGKLGCFGREVCAWGCRENCHSGSLSQSSGLLGQH
jgi:hypothetical protein